MKRTLATIFIAAACVAPASTSPTPGATASEAASATAAASVTASPTFAPTPTVAPSPTAGDASRYGYIVTSQGRIVVRGERETDASIAIDGEVPVASHDGKRIAFWHTAPHGDDPQELRVVEVATGSERVVTMIPPGQAGGAIAWANDDTGLLYETHSTAPAPPGPPTAPPSQMFSYDFSVSQAAIFTDAGLRETGGLVFIPLAWDKSAQLAFALTTGEGGYAAQYIVWDKHTLPAGVSSVKKTQFPWLVIYSDVKPTSDGTVMLANDREKNGVRFWPSADITNSQFLTPAPDRTLNSIGASWRPGSHGDFAWVQGFSVSLYTFATDRVPTLLHKGQSDVAIVTWRADGSAILLNEIGRGIFVVDLVTLKETPLPHLGFATTGGGVLLR